MSGRRALAAGNWKMNGERASLGELKAIVAGAANAGCDVAICPPATLIAAAFVVTEGSPVRIGGQDCHAEKSGAHTGDISAEMIADAGATLVIVGHSERRTEHKETDADVRTKALAAWRAGLVAILCIGETQEERQGGMTDAVLDRQIAGSVPEGATATNLVVAYEPVWAIGTGRTATPEQAQDVVAHIKQHVRARFLDGSPRVLYGGSVTPANAASLFAERDIDGALVGGVSLRAEEFGVIVAAAETAAGARDTD